MSGTLAFLGASSQIARDLIHAMAQAGRHRLLLYVRDVPATQAWLRGMGLESKASVHAYAAYDALPHDAVLNFVGVGDPRRAAAMGDAIFAITQQYDALALAGLKKHPNRRYLFMSSGAVYGNVFQRPVTEASQACIAVNAVTAQDWYAVAKLHAEVRHRARSDAQIVDLRIFNYFSRTQDLSARFFITDLLRAIRTDECARIGADPMVRDYLHPSDFHQLIEHVLAAPPSNLALDCYTAAPVDKPSLLQAMEARFGLRYEVMSPGGAEIVNATGSKPDYYSLNRKAESFGYIPQYTSLAGVLNEASALLA